jgi:hypothetical protein
MTLDITYASGPTKPQETSPYQRHKATSRISGLQSSEQCAVDAHAELSPRAPFTGFKKRNQDRYTCRKKASLGNKQCRTLVKVGIYSREY